VSSAWLLRLYYLTSYASLGIFLPFISPWLLAYGISGFALSVVCATRPLAGVLAPLFFGWLADRFRLRGSLMQWACLASVLPFSVITLLVLSNYRVGVLSALVATAMFSLLRIPMLAIADVSALERPQHIGSLRLWGSMGFLLAALAFGFLFHQPRSVAFPLSISLSLVAAFAVARRLPQRAGKLTAEQFEKQTRFLTREHAIMFAVWVLWSASHVAYDTCISLHVHDLGGGSGDVSLAWGIGTLSEVVMMGICGLLLPKAPCATWTLIGLLITTLRWLLLAHVGTLLQLLLLQPLHAVSFALLWMTWLDYVKQYAPAHVLGRAQGVFSTAVSLGAAAGIFVWGPLYASLGARTVFRFAAYVSGAASLLSLLPVLSRSLPRQGFRQASS
jgi:PPP family 3-phenylpropionic acid transporter